MIKLTVSGVDVLNAVEEYLDTLPDSASALTLLEALEDAVSAVDLYVSCDDVETP